VLTLGSLAHLATASDRALLALDGVAQHLSALPVILSARVELALWHLRRGR